MNANNQTVVDRNSSTHVSWVCEVLDPDQLSATKPTYGRRVLGHHTLAVLWGLRIYVLFMAAMIGLEVWRALQGGG